MRERWVGKWAEGRIAAKLYVLVRDYHAFVKRGCYAGADQSKSSSLAGA